MTTIITGTEATQALHLATCAVSTGMTAREQERAFTAIRDQNFPNPVAKKQQRARDWIKPRVLYCFVGDPAPDIGPLWECLRMNVDARFCGKASPPKLGLGPNLGSLNVIEYCTDSSEFLSWRFRLSCILRTLPDKTPFVATDDEYPRGTLTISFVQYGPTRQSMIFECIQQKLFRSEGHFKDFQSECLVDPTALGFGSKKHQKGYFNLRSALRRSLDQLMNDLFIREALERYGT